MRKTIVLRDVGGKVGGMLKIDGSMAVIESNSATDNCILNVGGELKAYRVVERVVSGVSIADWENAECLFLHGDVPRLYGVSSGVGNYERLWRRIELERDRASETLKKEQRRAEKRKSEEKRVSAKHGEQVEDLFAEKRRENKIDVFSINGGENPEFYYSIKQALDEMFVCYPEEKTLEKLIPDSKWVSVTYGANSSYVVGTMQIDGVVKYICYGLPASADTVPPSDLSGICEWIPGEDRTTGYWVVFQDAVTGETLTRIE